MPLLATDFHLTDSPADEYRWEVFDHLESLGKSLDEPYLFILGDIVDRKDRHPAPLVNRIADQLARMTETYEEVLVMMGNHDKPFKGSPFWAFLNYIPNVHYIYEPTFLEKSRIYILPYSADPSEDWQALDFSKAEAIFMHQCVNGVKENGIELKAPHMIPMPRNIPIYSGDIHTEQKVRNITYIGAPHPVKYGDTYPCRITQLTSREGGYKVRKVFDLDPPLKAVFEITSLPELHRLKVKPGDQVRVRFSLPVGKMGEWPQYEAAIKQWADENGIDGVKIEPIVESSPDKERPEAVDENDDPQMILAEFGKIEGIDDDTLQQGMLILEEVLKGA